MATFARPEGAKGPGKADGGLGSLDPVAIERLYCMHRDGLLRHAARIVGDVDRAEDLVQQAFVKSIRHLDEGPEIKDTLAWMHRCVHNLCLDFLRRESLGDGSGTASVLVDDPVVEATEMREKCQFVNDALVELPKAQRSVFVMAEYRGMGSAQIADSMGSSVGAVRASLHRARLQLRRAVSVKSAAAVSPVLIFKTSIGRAFVVLLRKLHSQAGSKASLLLPKTAPLSEYLSGSASVVVLAVGLATVGGVTVPHYDSYSGTDRAGQAPAASFHDARADGVAAIDAGTYSGIKLAALKVAMVRGQKEPGGAENGRLRDGGSGPQVTDKGSSGGRWISMPEIDDGGSDQPEAQDPVIDSGPTIDDPLQAQTAPATGPKPEPEQRVQQQNRFVTTTVRTISLQSPKTETTSGDDGNTSETVGTVTSGR